MAKRVKQALDENYFRENLLKGNRPALARAMSLVERNSPGAKKVYRAIHGRQNRAHVIGITGAPGAGKSSLVNAYVTELRLRNKTVGVIAIDPSSPFTGGSILGDRVRMTKHCSDEGVFVRSLASHGHLGGLSCATGRVVDIMDAAGFDIVIVETVGTGQSEVEVMEIAQSVVVVCAPSMGDDIQAVKAGILEIADILVVNKADLPLADITERQLRDATSLDTKRDQPVPVLKISSTNNEGLTELADTLSGHHKSLGPEVHYNAAEARMQQLVVVAATDYLKEQLTSVLRRDLKEVRNGLSNGSVELESAARKAIDMVARRNALDNM